jgi:serine/threonine protein kinase
MKKFKLFKCHFLIFVEFRDIKALNIFLMQSNLLKLGDFGIAKILDPNNGLLETVINNLSYFLFFYLTLFVL